MEAEPKESSGCRIFVVSGLVALLICLSPFIYMFCMMLKASHDVEAAQEEFKRTVKPDDLRAWVMMQAKKHPEGGYIEKSQQEWPANFPHFPTKYFRIYLSKYEAPTPDGALGAHLVWEFLDQGLKVDLIMNSDGSAFDRDGEQSWSGISFTHLHK